ncbi:MAG: anthranilate 1,2-dioxygenase small subunit [Alphaproteobacteria bacterium]|jgi:anthranilate 1,2-dioxygenase small subunit|nr:anthranilate 1,2-dioxygenase small subunit [Alphaproteobacteria bacterium]
MSETITLERILRLQADYIRCIDNNELETWPDFFADDCFYKVTTAENYKRGFEAGIIYADSKGMLVDRVAALREANIYERQSYRHIVGIPTILANGGAQAESETPFIVVRIMHDGQTDIFATGRYFDSYRIEGDKLKLTKKVAVCDSSVIDTLMALPL